MTNNSSNITELPEKILQGIRKAVQKLIEHSAANNDTMVISDEQGNIKTVSAKELLDTAKK